MKKCFISLAFGAISLAALAQTPIHVATDGDDTGPGTQASPYATIEKALQAVEPGGTIYVHAGTYYPEKRILVPEKATDADHRIRLMAYGADEVIIDGSKMNPQSANEFKGSRCMYFPYWANYWYIKGITFQNAKDNGVKLEGSYNIFENCIFRNNNDTGLQLGLFKDWSIEETKSFPIKGTPEFNPGYTYCRGNKVINCDSYNNYDAYTYTGTDDGGDADGFACKLFPGPGNEFYGCRAWNNSDDNWDLYMVYHPVVIDNCWAWNAALDADGNKTPGNGNGFKLGGGGSSGGSAFDQSTGAHVVRNCVAFSNTVKGFDQNNAYEGMYLFNNVAWDNEYNYRFPTVFKFGGMHIRNCIGFLPRKLNHEFLSADKEGSLVPDTDYNSWTAIDGCDAYKDGNKVGKNKVYAADHTTQFISLSPELAKAPRQADGSLPENDFARLVAQSIFVDKGEKVENFTPVRFMTETEAAAYGLTLDVAPSVTIEYNGAAPDMGAFESGTPTVARLYLISGDAEQLVYTGSEIEPVTLKWSGATTDLNVEGADGLNVVKDIETKSLVISGTLTSDATVTVTTVGGENAVVMTLVFKVSNVAPATLTCTTANATQTIFYNTEIEPVTFTMGGGATSFKVEGLPDGLTYSVSGNTLTISGSPQTAASYTVTALGGMTPVSMNGRITLETAYRILTGGWYNIQDAYEALPADLNGVVSIESGDSYTTKWDTAYNESGSVPAGCTEGAVNVERGGAIVWKLPSVMELKANVHFTGGRYLQVKWKYDDEETEHTWTSDKLAKTTLQAWDVLAAAGITVSNRPVTIKFVNDGSKNNGGIRVYDFYVKVYADSSESSLPTLNDNSSVLPTWCVTNTAIVFDNEIAGAALYSLDGRLISATTSSAILPRLNATQGVYILQVINLDGTSAVTKIRL